MLKNERLSTHPRTLRISLILAAGGVFLYWARGLILPAVYLVAGGALIAFLLEPVSRLFEKKFPRGLSALAALAVGAAALLAFAAVLLPTLIRQLQDLIASLPAVLENVRQFLSRITAPFGDLGAQPDLNALSGRIGSMIHRIADAAGVLAGGISRFSLMIVLSFFLLRDREKLFLRLELLVPLRFRRSTVLAGRAVCRELRLYLRGQAMIALCVGALSSLGLMLVGVPSALVLGLVVGVFNMIPYFGPVLGSVPAVLIALGRSPMTALWASAVLVLVQQMDGSLISPRIMGNLTGFSPAVVLVAVFIGGQAGGIAGMLVALPLLLTARTCLRVYAQHAQDQNRTKSVFATKNIYH